MKHDFTDLAEAKKWLENIGFKESIEDSHVWRKGAETMYIVTRWGGITVHKVAGTK
jgi:hypothetical protein